MRVYVIAALAASMAAGPALAQPAFDVPTSPASPVAPTEPVTPAPEYDANGVYQVYRITDNGLNCGQLIAEMNSLNATVREQTEAQAQAQANANTGRRAAGGVLGGALGGFARGQIARNVGGLGLGGALAAQGATDAAAAAVGQAVAEGGDAAAPVTNSNESQRLARVTQLFSAKGC